MPRSASSLIPKPVCVGRWKIIHMAGGASESYNPKDSDSLPPCNCLRGAVKCSNTKQIAMPAESPLPCLFHRKAQFRNVQLVHDALVHIAPVVFYLPPPLLVHLLVRGPAEHYERTDYQQTTNERGGRKLLAHRLWEELVHDGDDEDGQQGGDG